MPRMCCVGACSSNYKKNGDYTKVFRLPTDLQERQRWLDQLPNIISKITPDTVICERHWPPDYETVKRKGRIRPLNPPSIFALPMIFQKQTKTTPRNVNLRKIDSESRKKVSDKRNPAVNPDEINSWYDLQSYCMSLPTVNCIKKEDRVILCEVTGSPPTIQYSVTIFMNLSVCAFYGSSRVPIFIQCFICQIF